MRVNFAIDPSNGLPKEQVKTTDGKMDNGILVKIAELKTQLSVAAKEAEGYSFSFKADDFSPEKISNILNRIEEVSGYIDRLLSILAKVEKINADANIIKVNIKTDLEFKTNAELAKPEYLIQKGFAFQERQAYVTTKYIETINLLVSISIFITHGSERIRDRIDRQIKRFNQIKMDYYRSIDALSVGSITKADRL